MAHRKIPFIQYIDMYIGTLRVYISVLGLYNTDGSHTMKQSRTILIYTWSAFINCTECAMRGTIDGYRPSGSTTMVGCSRGPFPSVNNKNK